MATGSFVPDQVVTNEDLQRTHGFDPAWVFQRTGIRERRYAPPGMATSDMAIAAARQVLDRAGASAADVDLLLVGTFTPDLTCPSAACLVQHALGITAPAVDLVAACAGFMYSLVTGMHFVAAGNSKLALIIGAECMSRILDPRDQRTYPLFGDGAGAVLLSPGKREQGLLAYSLGADGSGAPLLHRPVGGTRTPFACHTGDPALQYLQMDGKAVFKWAIRILEDTVGDVLKHAKLGVRDLDLVVLHQANIRIINAAAESLGFDMTKLLINLDRYGNTSAGSIPIALDEAHAAGRIKRGDRILMSGFGAGLSWGTAVVEW